jgi:hypothetical protein
MEDRHVIQSSCLSNSLLELPEDEKASQYSNTLNYLHQVAEHPGDEVQERKAILVDRPIRKNTYREKYQGHIEISDPPEERAEARVDALSETLGNARVPLGFQATTEARQEPQDYANYRNTYKYPVLILCGNV